MDIRIDIKPSLESVGRAFQAIRIGTALEKGLLEAGYRIEAKAKPVTPVDTGLLRASIMTIPLGGTLGGVVVKPHVEYAGFVHEGTRYMAARPYLKWGVEKAQPGMPEIVKKNVEIEIDTQLSKI